MTVIMSDVAPTFDLGVERYRAGAYAEAEAIFARLHAAQEQVPEEAQKAADAGDAATLRMLGLARFRLGKLEPALALLEAALEAAPADPETQLHYGLVLHAAGRHAEAAAQFRSSAKLLPLDPAPHMNLSAALLALGDAAGAVRAAKHARRRDANLPQVHYMLGLASMAADRLDDAIRAFAAALQLDPKLADALVNIGVICYRRNDIEGAKTAMRGALAVAPGHIGAASNLGAFLRLTGQVEASEKLLDDVLARDPEAAEVRVNQAAALLSEGRPREALVLLDAKSVPADPRLAQHWQMQRSLALLQVGRPAEAREVVARDRRRAAGDGAADAVAARFLLALAANDHESARTYALAMERALTTDRLVPEHRIMAHFDLARFWSAQREADRTFTHWTAAHRQLSRFQPFSRERSPRLRRRNDRSLSIAHGCMTGRARKTAIRRRSSSSACRARERPWRSRSSPRIRKASAPASAGRSRRPSARSAATNAARCRADRGARRFDPRCRRRSVISRELHALAPDKARIVDKMPGNFNFLGLAALMLPGARIIHCVRDPRDIGLSIFSFRFYGYHPYAHDLGDLGWYIAQHDRLMAHWREALPNPILTLALKDWVEDFGGTLRRVLDFIELPYDPACERFYESSSRVMTVSRSQVRQPINARGLGRWRRYAAQLQPLIDALTENGVVLS